MDFFHYVSYSNIAHSHPSENSTSVDSILLWALSLCQKFMLLWVPMLLARSRWTWYQVLLVLSEWGPRGWWINVFHFFLTSTHPKSQGQTYISLIPKNEDPRMGCDLRSISRYNICYKIISKILTNRLKHVLLNLVSNEQSDLS